ncbi:MAG: GNAT family N-acetyltransferase [Eubacteriales bacterium]|nr:GNAT family N-acetyltransferase [Eubacteriales bacterium]
MRFVKDYMRDETLRHELNTLTRNTFGFDFEDWVLNGYFQGDYIPYSYEENGEMLSNVSANIMTFEQEGRTWNFIQIGTVMTAQEHRKKGLASELVKKIFEDYKENCDGIYLFANLEALGFYEKQGFEIRKETRYILKRDVELFDGKTDEAFCLMDNEDDTWKQQYLDYLKNATACGAFEQVNRYGLTMFYTAGFEDVYYSKKLDCFVVIEQDGDTKHLQSIISKKKVTMEDVLKKLDLQGLKLQLGFVPDKENAHLFDQEQYDGADDYRLYCIGEGLACIEDAKLYFPEFSHA